jgi:hypothetical protein
LLAEFKELESSALLVQIVEDTYDSYSSQEQQKIEDLLADLTETVDEVVQADQANQNFIKQVLNHPVLLAPEASAADIKATYDILGQKNLVLNRQYVDRKN